MKKKKEKHLDMFQAAKKIEDREARRIKLEKELEEFRQQVLKNETDVPYNPDLEYMFSLNVSK